MYHAEEEVYHAEEETLLELSHVTMLGDAIIPTQAEWKNENPHTSRVEE